MPYFHCDKCHHEFEGYPEKRGTECTAPKCDWCHAGSHMIEEKTPLEQMGDEIEAMGAEKFFEKLDLLEKEIGEAIGLGGV
jgi:hypothetical protein